MIFCDFIDFYCVFNDMSLFFSVLFSELIVFVPTSFFDFVMFLLYFTQFSMFFVFFFYVLLVFFNFALIQWPLACYGPRPLFWI